MKNTTSYVFWKIEAYIIVSHYKYKIYGQKQLYLQWIKWQLEWMAMWKSVVYEISEVDKDVDEYYTRQRWQRSEKKSNYSLKEGVGVINSYLSCA